MTVVKPAFLNLLASASSTEPRKDSRARGALRTPFPRASPHIPARDFRRGPVGGLSYPPGVLGRPRAQGLPGEAVSPGRRGLREEGSHLTSVLARRALKSRSPARVPRRAGLQPRHPQPPASSSGPGCPSRPGSSQPGRGLPGAGPPSVLLTVLPEPRTERVSLQRVLGGWRVFSSVSPVAPQQEAAPCFQAVCAEVSPEFKDRHRLTQKSSPNRRCTDRFGAGHHQCPVSSADMRIVGFAAMSLVGPEGVGLPGRDESQPRTLLLCPWGGGSCWNASFIPGAAACLFGGGKRGNLGPGPQGLGLGQVRRERPGLEPESRCGREVQVPGRSGVWNQSGASSRNSPAPVSWTEKPACSHGC